MLKVYCDFNDGTADDRYWILWYADRPLGDQIAELGLREGDRVLLCQDADDFEVEGELLFNQTHPNFLGEKLCARPDYRTFRRL